MGIHHSMLTGDELGAGGISFNKQEISILYNNFKDLDTDGNGLLDKKEFFDLPELRENPIVQRLITVFDKNKDDKVSFYEFIVGLNMLNSGSMFYSF
jgi:serine/threonine-protein phosphatase 2B regulatory subunit